MRRQEEPGSARASPGRLLQSGRRLIAASRVGRRRRRLHARRAASRGLSLRNLRARSVTAVTETSTVLRPAPSGGCTCRRARGGGPLVRAHRRPASAALVSSSPELGRSSRPVPKPPPALRRARN